MSCRTSTLTTHTHIYTHTCTHQAECILAGKSQHKQKYQTVVQQKLVGVLVLTEQKAYHMDNLSTNKHSTMLVHNKLCCFNCPSNSVLFNLLCDNLFEPRKKCFDLTALTDPVALCPASEGGGKRKCVSTQRVAMQT